MSKQTDKIAREMAEEDLTRAVQAVLMEVRKATVKFGPFASSHEGYAILREEVDELWDDVKANNLEGARAEAVQVAAMAIRFLIDVRSKQAMEKLREDG